MMGRKTNGIRYFVHRAAEAIIWLFSGDDLRKRETIAIFGWLFGLFPAMMVATLHPTPGVVLGVVWSLVAIWVLLDVWGERYEREVRT